MSAQTSVVKVDEIIEKIRGVLSDEVEILAILQYGSHVYGTNNEFSDNDVLVVVDRLTETLTIHGTSVELTIVSAEFFQYILTTVDFGTQTREELRRINNYEVRIIESIFTPSEYIYVGHEWVEEQRNIFAQMLADDRTQTLKKIRCAFSSISQNSKVKAKKKVQDGEINTGKKSIWHSIRILMFGLQIGTTGAIHDFTEAVPIWEDLQEYDGDTDNFYKKWAKTGSPHLLSQFKTVLPKT